MRNNHYPEILKALVFLILAISTPLVKTAPCKAADVNSTNKKEELKYKHTLSEFTVLAPIEASINLSHEPCLGETVTATITVTFLDDISYVFRSNDEKAKNMNYDKNVKMWLKDLRWNTNISRHIKMVLNIEGADIVTGESEFYWDMTKSESKSLEIRLRLNSTPIRLSGVIKWFFAEEKTGPYLVAPVKGVGFVLLNKMTGQLGTRNELEELLRKLPEYGYDIVLGKRETEWEDYPQVELERLRETLPDDALKPLAKIQEEMKEIHALDSTMTDLEILDMLHDIECEMLVRYGIHKKEESLPILLKGRILMKKQNFSKWDAIDKIIVEEMNQKRQRVKLIWFTAVFFVIMLFVILLIISMKKKKGKIR